MTRISTGIESKGLYGCPGQPPSEISSLPGQKIPIPRPPGGGLRVRRSSRKNSNLKISELKCICTSGGDPGCFEHTRYMIFHVVSLVLHEVVVQKSQFHPLCIFLYYSIHLYILGTSIKHIRFSTEDASEVH